MGFWACCAMLCDKMSWLRSETMSLLHFSVMACVITLSGGIGCLPFIMCFMIGVCVVLAFVAWFFYCRYVDTYKQLEALRAEDRIAAASLDELEACDVKMAALRRQLAESSALEKNSTRAMVAIRKAIECSITLSVPEDPVVSSTGHVFSSRAINRYAVSLGGYVRCPITRQHPCVLVRCFPLREVCQETLVWEEVSRRLV